MTKILIRKDQGLSLLDHINHLRDEGYRMLSVRESLDTIKELCGFGETVSFPTSTIAFYVEKGIYFFEKNYNLTEKQIQEPGIGFSDSDFDKKENVRFVSKNSFHLDFNPHLDTFDYSIVALAYRNEIVKKANRILKELTEPPVFLLGESFDIAKILHGVINTGVNNTMRENPLLRACVGVEDPSYISQILEGDNYKFGRDDLDISLLLKNSVEDKFYNVIIELLRDKGSRDESPIFNISLNCSGQVEDEPDLEKIIVGIK